MKNYQNNIVKVLAPDNEELMPCHPARARKFLRDKKAILVSKSPFTIKMLNEPSNRVKVGDGE